MFDRPLAQAEVNAILRSYGFRVDYFKYIATNGMSGGASTVANPDLESVAGELKSRHGPDIHVIEITYVYVRSGAENLVALLDNVNIVLVGIGLQVRADELRAEGKIIITQPPPTLCHWHQRLRGQ